MASSKPSERLARERVRIADLERRRIGQELHDGIGQQIAGLGAWLRALQRRAEAGEPLEADHFAPLIETLAETAAEVRRLSRCLVPLEVPADGLAAALAALVRRCDLAGSVRCEFECSSAPALADAETATHLYRIAQEALRNALEHANATRVLVRLVAEPELRLEVTDDGGGPSGRCDEQTGVGLSIMRARAEAIGGSLSVHAAARGGTTVACRLPVGARPRLAGGGSPEFRSLTRARARSSAG